METNESPVDIDLWLAFQEDIVDAPLLERLESLMDDAERLQEARFVFEADRRRHRVTRALVRTVLSRHAPIAPADWVFAVGAHGRPRIANVHPEVRDLDFNVSHTPGLIALGVARRCTLGIDVEHWAARAVSDSLARHCFTAREVEALMSAPAPRFQDEFFQYWTFKESYIKARGLGMAIPMDGFEFDYPCARSVRMSASPEVDTAPSRWRFWQYRPASGYLLAVCADLPEGTPARIRLRRIVPTRVEELLQLPATRASAPRDVNERPLSVHRG